MDYLFFVSRSEDQERLKRLFTYLRHYLSDYKPLVRELAAYYRLEPAERTKRIRYDIWASKIVVVFITAGWSDPAFVEALNDPDHPVRVATVASEMGALLIPVFVEGGALPPALPAEMKRLAQEEPLRILVTEEDVRNLAERLKNLYMSIFFAKLPLPPDLEGIAPSQEEERARAMAEMLNRDEEFLPPPSPLEASKTARDAGRSDTLGDVSQPAAAPEDVKPHFSAYSPEAVKAGESYTLMVFAHTEAAREQVRALATGFAGLMGGRQQRSEVQSTLPVEIGNRLTLVPRIPGIKFVPAEQVLIWQPPYQFATFLFRTPPILDAPLTGRVLVFKGPLIVGEIPLHMPTFSTAVASPLPQESQIKEYETVFASYSHRDLPVMEYFRRTRALMGQKMLTDIYDLRAGEHWSERLLEMIDESSVFQLFWSRNSAQSEYCRREWAHARRHLESRPRFIQPVWWTVPMPPPPPELAELHFQKVELPPVTRMQLTWSRIRELFGR